MFFIVVTFLVVGLYNVMCRHLATLQTLHVNSGVLFTKATRAANAANEIGQWSWVWTNDLIIHHWLEPAILSVMIYFIVPGGSFYLDNRVLLLPHKIIESIDTAYTPSLPALQLIHSCQAWLQFHVVKTYRHWNCHLPSGLHHGELLPNYLQAFIMVNCHPPAFIMVNC